MSNREILSRGKRVDIKEWIEGYFVIDGAGRNLIAVPKRGKRVKLKEIIHWEKKLKCLKRSRKPLKESCKVLQMLALIPFLVLAPSFHTL